MKQRNQIVLALLVTLTCFGCGRDTANSSAPRVAIVQYAPSPLMDQGVEGITAGLAGAGYRDGINMRLQKFDAQGDMGTLAGICQQVASADYTAAITISTPALQAMANANRDGRVIHVFGLVTDPFASGIGLDRARPAQHPPHLCGIGTFEPVADGFRLAKRINPALQKVGVVYNPGEACSVICVDKARAVCRELGITLEETTVDNSAMVVESVQALLTRGVQAFWTGGDNTISAAFSSFAAVAGQRGVPVFTSNVEHARNGAAFSYGANYREVGLLIGTMAAAALRDPRSISATAIADITPAHLAVGNGPFTAFSPEWQAALRQLREEEQRQGRSI